MRYTKKPVTIEAVRFMGLTDFGDPQFDVADGMPDWLMDAMSGPEHSTGSMWSAPGQAFIGEGEPPKELFIGTMEGQHIASPGDWIIQGIKGELYPCKPDIFEAIYDAADDHPGPAWKEGDSLAAPKDETPADFLARLGMDGMEWAKAFVQQFEGKSIGYDASSHGVDDILGWFCNAIMAGYDRGRAQGWKEDAPHGHERIAPEIVQVAKEARRSILLDMQSECIQLRVALAKARDQFAFYTKEHITKAEGFEHKARHAGERGDKMVQENRIEDAQSSRDKAGVNRTYAEMCQKAIDCRPATGATDALTSALAETAVEHPSDLPNGSVDRLRTAAKPFVIGHGFSDTVGDSDGDDGA